MMPVSLRFAIRLWLNRPLRPILCALAISAAVALVVCVGAGFDSIRASLQTGIGQMLGVAEVHVRPAQKGTQNRLPANMLDTIRAQPEVELATARLQAPIALTTPQDHRWFDAVGVDTSLDDILRPKNYVQGRPLASGPDAANEIVADQAVVDLLAAKLNDSLKLNGDANHERTVKLVGILKRPQLEMLQRPTIYLPASQLADDVGIPLQYNVIDLKLRENTDLDAFAAALQSDLGSAAHVMPLTERRAEFERNTRGLHFALMILSMISGTCASLIIGTTLSVGIQERIRQFGQLRCIGASKGQLLAFLAADAALLMVVGLSLGVAFGLILSRAMVIFFPHVFLVYRITFSSILISLACGFVATLIGSLIPAWQVMRITPMEAVRAGGKAPRRHHVFLVGALGLLLIALQILLWQIPDQTYNLGSHHMPGRDLRFWCYIFGGIPLLFCGYCLLGPMLLLIAEHFGAVIVGSALAIRPALLRHAWSRTPWRAGGMIAALMIGVTLFTAVRERGSTMLSAWSLPEKFPDLILYNIYSVPAARAAKIRALPGVEDSTVLASFPVKLARPIFRIGHVLPEDATNFGCIEPAAFRKMVDVEFVRDPKDPNFHLSKEAYADQAYARLDAGKAIFVSREFYVARGIGVGSTIPFRTAKGQVVEFTVAAVIQSSMLDMAAGYFDIRRTFQDAALSTVLGTFADAQEYFQLNGINGMLVNVNHDRPLDDTLADLRPQIAQLGLQSAPVAEIKNGYQKIITNVVSAFSLLALAALCVASLGVANMVIASVQARKYEFGVLRAIGAGQGQLVRLVLAEITLVSLTAGVLGGLAGLHLAFMATRVDRTLFGLLTKFDLFSPGTALIFTVSVLVTLALGYLAALYPAWKGATTAQQTLLSSGRA